MYTHHFLTLGLEDSIIQADNDKYFQSVIREKIDKSHEEINSLDYKIETVKNDIISLSSTQASREDIALKKMRVKVEQSEQLFQSALNAYDETFKKAEQGNTDDYTRILSCD
jgi:hypothetical protein